MPIDANWTRMERLFNSFPLPYPIVSIIIALILYIIFLFFDLKLANSFISEQRLIMAIETATIAYQISCSIFILRKMKSIFLNLSYLKNENTNVVLSSLKKRFISNYYYLVLVLTIVPFYLIFYQNYWKYFNDIIGTDIPYYLPCFIYIYFFLGIIILSLLGNILWIIINIAWGLNDNANNSADFNKYWPLLSFNNKIKLIRSSVIQVLFYYFINITLLILTYLNPLSIGVYEIVVLVILLLIGIILFFVGLNAIKKIQKYRLEYEYDSIDRKIHDQNQKIASILESGDYTKKEQIDFISSMLDLLRKQRDDLSKFDLRIYNFTTVGTFITSFLIPALSLLDKIKLQIMDFTDNQHMLINISTNATAYIKDMILLILNLVNKV